MAQEDQEDKNLVVATLNGDRSSFSFLFQKYRKMVHSLAFRFLGPSSLLEDVLQETFLRAYRQLPQLQKPEHFGTWLGGICKNVSQEQLRKNPSSLSPLEKISASVAIAPSSLEEIQRVTLFQKIGELPEIFQEVLLLKYVNTLSYEQIALLLEITPAAVNARLNKARKLLKLKIEKEDLFDPGALP
jgi:RNA polymerase sigma-70 factor (ECF subfamily)